MSHSFEALVLPHLDAGYNLARWLLRDEASAEDVVQDAAIRAMRYFHSLDGAARPWFLTIVRNACFSYLQQRRDTPESSGFDDEMLGQFEEAAGRSAPSPENVLERRHERDRVNQAIRALKPLLREVLVLREIEGLEYAEIAQIAMIPMGTVMSRLSRAREKLKTTLALPNQAHH